MKLTGKKLVNRESAKLLFVNPCLRKNSLTKKILPVGLGYIMTYFQESGYKSDLLDIDVHEYTDEEVEKYLRLHRYDFILLGSIVTHYKWIKWFVNTAKSIQPDTKVIVGNSVAGSIPDLFLTNTSADVVIIGEGEMSALEVVDGLRLNSDLKDIKGIAFHEGDKIIKTEKRKACDINTLPFINWDLFDVNRYFDIFSTSKRGPSGTEGKVGSPLAIPISTARGCAFKCTFCHYVFWDDPYRIRKPGSVIREMKEKIEKYDVKYFQFWDDLSFASAKQIERMADAIIASGIKISWSAAIRVDLFSRNKLSEIESRQIAKKMKESGCIAVGFSLESGNKEILEMMNKKIETESFLSTVKILREVAITCNTSVVFGYPIETEESIRETFDQCRKAKVYPSIGFLLPLPSTGMYDYAKTHGYITDEDAYLESITERQDICVNMTNLSNETILNEIKKGAQSLNNMLGLGLDDSEFIRTGRYRNDNGGAIKKSVPLDPENIKRNENDFSFNYSEAAFEFDDGELEENRR